MSDDVRQLPPPRVLRPRRRFVRPQVLPTMLTLGNLACGFLAIAKAADAMAVPRPPGPLPEEMLLLLQTAGWYVFVGMIFDVLDGRVARLTGGTSAMGNILDSIADVVTFGLAPAFIAKCIAEGVGGMQDRKITYWFSVFFALMAALRLARYSSRHEESEEASLWFDGLPTPGAAGVIAALAVLINDQAWRPEATLLRLLPWATLALGVLMVSKLPYAHFANRFLKGRKPVTYLVLGIFLWVLSQAWNPELVLACGFLAYALSGPVTWLVRGRRRRPAGAAAGAQPGMRDGEEAA